MPQRYMLILADEFSLPARLLDRSHDYRMMGLFDRPTKLTIAPSPGLLGFLNEFRSTLLGLRKSATYWRRNPSERLAPHCDFHRLDEANSARLKDFGQAGSDRRRRTGNLRRLRITTALTTGPSGPNNRDIAGRPSPPALQSRRRDSECSPRCS